jgi:hypothetical protein
MDMSNGYEITEKDINTVLGILKRSDPENATPEMAIAILEELQKRVHVLSHTDPELLIEIYNKLKKDKKLKTN